MRPVIALIIVIMLQHQAWAANLRSAYIDQEQNVHIVTSRGIDRKITTKGHRAKAKLSPDGETVTWLVNQRWIPTGEIEPGASELVIFKKGHAYSIKCEPYIRDYWFCQKGLRIAIDCGGAHFAGREILYDVITLKELDSFEQSATPTDKRPSWSASGNRFNPDGE